MGKKPEAYVASIEKNGYNHPLYTANGQEIRNPTKFLETSLRNNAAIVGAAGHKGPKVPRERRVLTRTLTAAPKKRIAFKRVAARSESVAERPEGLYKEDGS